MDDFIKLSYCYILSEAVYYQLVRSKNKKEGVRANVGKWGIYERTKF